MNRILSYTQEGNPQLDYSNQWKYCPDCGFCHASDFKRCLKSKVKRMMKREQ